MDQGMSFKWLGIVITVVRITTLKIRDHMLNGTQQLDFLQDIVWKNKHLLTNRWQITEKNMLSPILGKTIRCDVKALPQTL